MSDENKDINLWSSAGEKKEKRPDWGQVTQDGAEIWDTPSVFTTKNISFKDKAKLLFYPKKFYLYRFIHKRLKQKIEKGIVVRVLDIGCGTGASMIDFKRLLGAHADIHGIEVVRLQTDMAKKRCKQEVVAADIRWYDGRRFPYEGEYFDAIYSSDVLGHVEDVPNWLSEIHRVLKPGGTIAIFSESKLGKHAFVRNYLYKRGLNVDPHAQFHISLYSKNKLRSLFNEAGLKIEDMRTLFWFSFLVHPDEFHKKLSMQRRFLLLKAINKILYLVKKITHPFSTAACELFGLIESLLVGKKIESQGYVILGRKE